MNESKPMSNRRIIVLCSIATMTLLSGLIILGYLWYELGERGLYADATGTSGHTTASEVVLILVGGLLAAISISLLAVLWYKTKDR
jgi:hypothetical protein